MAKPLVTERKPLMPVFDFLFPPGMPYRVKGGDNWSSIALKAGVGAWELIEFNFRTRNPDEVNWYLREYVGCVEATSDARNWKFSSDLTGGRGAWKGGTIWLPLRRSGFGRHRITNIRTNANGIGGGSASGAIP
jgi:hypothetical protein